MDGGAILCTALAGFIIGLLTEALTKRRRARQALLKAAEGFSELMTCTEPLELRERARFLYWQTMADANNI